VRGAPPDALRDVPLDAPPGAAVGPIRRSRGWPKSQPPLAPQRPARQLPIALPIQSR
jgi:hypothetical protein